MCSERARIESGCSFYAAVVHMFSLEGNKLKCELFRLQNTRIIMSRYNPVELLWGAMSRAAALGARENDDPGRIDIMDIVLMGIKVLLRHQPML